MIVGDSEARRALIHGLRMCSSVSPGVVVAVLGLDPCQRPEPGAAAAAGLAAWAGVAAAVAGLLAPAAAAPAAAVVALPAPPTAAAALTPTAEAAGVAAALTAVTAGAGVGLALVSSAAVAAASSFFVHWPEHVAR